ncbi:MAG TPA: hypothetical protein VGN26_03815 [Armatimonadota bacterium]
MVLVALALLLALLLPSLLGCKRAAEAVVARESQRQDGLAYLAREGGRYSGAGWAWEQRVEGDAESTEPYEWQPCW